MLRVVEKETRYKREKELTNELNDILPQVLSVTGYKNQLSLNAKIGGKHDQFCDVRNSVIETTDQFIALWLEGLMNYCNELHKKDISKVYELLEYMQGYEVVMEYVQKFLERTFLKHYEELTKVKPKPADSIIWIGQQNANYGLLVSPRFKNGNWENDGSEVRKFKPDYFTIGHVLKTGLVIPFENEIMEFSSIDVFLKFLKNVLVRNSGSQYELEIAKMYCNYVKASENPLAVPLLIPEFRYGGIDKKHLYRLDFTIINPYTISKYGFEFSPWSTHGQLSGVKEKTQKQVNEEAKANFEKDMKKHKDFFRKHGVYSFIYTDSDLKDIKSVFDDIIGFLNPEKMHKQLKIHTMEQFYAYK